jgi:hypothetical protein
LVQVSFASRAREGSHAQRPSGRPVLTRLGGASVAQYAARLATHATLATHFAYDGSYARACGD